MTLAYAVGLCLGALFSAFVASRIFLWLLRNRNDGAARIWTGNALAFAAVVLISVFVRGGLDLPSASMHLVAQGVWVCVDLWRRAARRSAGESLR
jgi:hypothetical protein